MPHVQAMICLLHNEGFIISNKTYFDAPTIYVQHLDK